MDEGSAKILARAIQHLNAREEDAVVAICSEDFEWHPAVTAGGDLERKVYRGKRAMLDYWRELDTAFSEVQFRGGSMEVLDDDRVLYRGRVTARGRASQAPVDVPIWAIWRLAGGKIVHGAGFLSEREALEAAAGPAEPPSTI